MMMVHIDFDISIKYAGQNVNSVNNSVFLFFGLSIALTLKNWKLHTEIKHEKIPHPVLLYRRKETIPPMHCPMRRKRTYFKFFFSVDSKSSPRDDDGTLGGPAPEFETG